jgi:uncharacterized protein
MAADGLTPPSWWKRQVDGLQIRVSPVTGLLTLVIAGFVASLLYVLVVDDPMGGEPSAVVQIVHASPSSAESAPDGSLSMRSTVDDASANESLPPGHAIAPADIVVTDPDGTPYGDHRFASADEVNDSDALPDLVEPSRHGLLPVVAPDGRRAAQAYAGTVPEAAANTPRIAILVGGMGLSTTITEDAIRKLPRAVTLAFAPYGRETERLSNRARRDGHELMLQIPLEPYDYPDNDPGPHTLLTGLSEEQNRDRLHWVMSRFTGYVGATNYMGGRFTSSRDTVRPLLGELRDRGLVYADDSSSPRSLAGEVAEEIGLPFVAADIIIDADPNRAAIAEALANLENLALDNGSAVGVATGLPAGVEEIADWIPTLELKGITLVPLTALVSAGDF